MLNSDPGAIITRVYPVRTTSAPEARKGLNKVPPLPLPQKPRSQVATHTPDTAEIILDFIYSIKLVSGVLVLIVYLCTA
jgi:hypothetical protein